MSYASPPISIVRARKEQSKLFLLDPPSSDSDVTVTAVIYTVAPPGGLKITHVRNGTGIFTDIAEHRSMTILESKL